MNSGGLLYDSLGDLTRPKGLLKHREIPSDLGEIPINKYLSQLFLKPKEIPNDPREIPMFKSFLKRSVEVLGFICHERRSIIALGLAGLA